MAGGFDLMRFQKCSDTLIPTMHKNTKWIVFWVCACFVFFYCLGISPAIRSEARWFEVVREMLLTGDWLHPRINGQPYFDKPLVSYWLAAIISKLTSGRIDSSVVVDANAALWKLAGGRVTEMTVRLPSAFFALAGLGCIISAARKLYSERTAYLAAWLLLSTYSYIFWGRLAEADIQLAVFIMMAVTVYLCNRETASFWAYFAFWGCCALGAQTKGVAAFIIPPALAAIDCIIRKSFRRHLNWKFFLALFLGGICLYFAPYVLVLMKSGSDGGIMPMLRENLARLLRPRNPNNDSWQVYFLPHLLIPWTPFFVFAVVDFVRGLIRAVAKQGTASVEDLSSRAVAKQGTASVEDLSSRAVAKQGTASVEDLSSDTLWLFVSIVFIFILLQVYRPFRSCCALSIVPWCVLFTAAWLSEPNEAWTPLRKLTDKFFRLVDVLIPVAAALLILLPFLNLDRPLYQFFLYAKDFVPLILVFGAFAFVAGIAWLVIWKRSRKRLLRNGVEGAFAPSADPLNRVVPFTAFVLFTVFLFVIPKLNERESLMPNPFFFRYYVRGNAQRYQDHFKCQDLDLMKHAAFFGPIIDTAEAVYYLGRPDPVPMYSLEKPDEFRAFLAEIREKGGVVIARRDYVEDMEESEEWKDVVEMLHKPGMLLESSHLTGVQENKLRKLRKEPGLGYDPQEMKKIREIERKRFDVFYSIPVDIFYNRTPESILPPKSAEADTIEGTTQS